MQKLKFLLLFTSLIASVYILRHYSDSSKESFHPRLLGTLKTKFCSDASSTSTPTSSDIANAADFRSQFFQLMRGNENKLKATLKTSDWTGYVTSLISPTVVWLVFLALSIFGWLCYCICCCCDKKCPPCQCCRRNIEAKPYRGFELWGVVLFLVIFGTGIVGISAAGIIYSTQVQSGTQTTVCTLVSIYDNVVYGTSYNSTQWLGISPVMDRITAIIAQLATIPGTFYSTFGDTSWIDTGINNLLSQNRNIYTKFKGSQISSPNPANAYSTVPSLFITNSLGPYTTNATLTGSIDTQFEQSSVLFSSSLKSVYTASKNVADTANETSSTLNSSTDQIRSLYNSLKAYEGQIDDTLSIPYGYFNQINDGFYAAWAVNIVSALMGIVGAIGVYLLKWTRLRILLHCSWCFMSALMIIGFALSALFWPLGIVTIEGCDLYYDIMSSQKSYVTYNEIIPSDINSKLQTCLFGTGELSSEFGIQSQVNQLDGISSSFNALDSLKSNSSNFTLNSSDLIIDFWHGTSNNLMYGMTIDSSDTDDNNSFISMDSFNKWSDYSSSGSLQAVSCSYTQDNWVFNTSNCTYSTKWSTGASATDQIGNKVCIQINDFANSDATSRYGSMGTCSSSVSTNNLNYFSSLKNYDNSRRNLFNSLGNELSSLKTNNDNYNSKLLGFNQTVYGFVSNIKGFIGNVSDPKNGLVAGFNCAFLRNTVRDSYNAMCVSWFIPIYLQMIFICSTSVLMFLMSLLAYLAGMRFGKLHKMNDVDTWGGSAAKE